MHRNWRQLYPWQAMLVTAVFGYGAAMVGWITEREVLVGWATSGVCAALVIGVVTAAVVKKAHPYWGAWATACAINAGAWIALAAFHGFDYTVLSGQR